MRNEKKQIATTVETIVKQLRNNPCYNISTIQKKLDKKFYEIFQLSPTAISAIEDFCANFYEAL